MGARGCDRADRAPQLKASVGPRIMVSNTLSTEEMQFADAYLDLANPEAHQWAYNINEGVTQDSL